MKSINKVVARGVPCNICSDSISRPEKITTSLLIQAGVLFETQKIFEWAPRKRFDFYLPQFNTIIEVNGSQHYGFVFEQLSSFTYQDQKNVDTYKMSTAIANGISHYFIIKAETSTVAEILPQLCEYLSEVGIVFEPDQTRCEVDAAVSYVKKAADMWNSGKRTGEICQLLRLSRNTVIRYLKQAALAGMCNYSPKSAHQISQATATQRRKRSVRCVTTGEVFQSIRDASIAYGISTPSNIIRSCYGGRTAGKCDGVALSWEYV